MDKYGILQEQWNLLQGARVDPGSIDSTWLDGSYISKGEDR